MVRLRALLALMTVVLHLAALMLPATADASMDHAAIGIAETQVQAEGPHHPAEDCCVTAETGAPQASDAACAVCALSCSGLQATLAALASAPFALPAPRTLPLADQSLRGTTPEAALRPPRPRS